MTLCCRSGGSGHATGVFPGVGGVPWLLGDTPRHSMVSPGRTTPPQCPSRFLVTVAPVPPHHSRSRLRPQVVPASGGTA